MSTLKRKKEQRVLQRFLEVLNHFVGEKPQSCSFSDSEPFSWAIDRMTADEVFVLELAGQGGLGIFVLSSF